MKKFILLSLLVMFSGSTLFISCSSEHEAQISLEEQLLTDQAFENASTATIDFVFTAVTHNWLENMARINTVIADRPVSDLTESELSQINDLLGMDLNDYLRQVETFAISVNEVYDRYPQLAEMAQAERNALFAEVLSSSDAISNHIAALQENARGPFDWILCYLHDACVSNIGWLIPTVQDLLATGCDFISGIDLPIPFLDSAVEFVCTTLPGYVEAFLPGICDYIPCEP